MVAASDHPMEFRFPRQKIAQTIFSGKLINRSDRDKGKKQSHQTEEEKTLVDEAVLPMENQVVPTCKQKLSKMVPMKLNSEKKDNDDNGGGVYRQGVAEVLRCKKILDKSESESVVCDLLIKLQDMGLSFKTLEATGIGKSVSHFKKHASENVCRIAAALIKVWKRTADEWLKKQSSVNEATSLQVKPTEFLSQSHKIAPTIFSGYKCKTQSHEKAAKIGNGMMDLEKLEATKRKLHEGYEKAEKKKKQRRIQVIELHELTKQGLLPQERPCKRKGYGRC